MAESCAAGNPPLTAPGALDALDMVTPYTPEEKWSLGA
jgi:hypothetical protein